MADVAGKCRVCGCTDFRACFLGHPTRTCAWADAAHTLCSNPACISADKAKAAR